MRETRGTIQRESQENSTAFCKNELVLNTNFVNFIIKKINHATRSIDILMFLWLKYSNDPTNEVQRIVNALVSASRRGVSVRIFLSSKNDIDGLKLYKLPLKKSTSQRSMHAKVFCFDKKYIVVGSHNFSESSLCYNVEVSLGLADENISKQYSNFFDALWQS